MKQTKTMLRLELEVKPEMAAKCQLAAMAPMTALATGRRSILLTSRQISAAAVLDTLTMLKRAGNAADGFGTGLRKLRLALRGIHAQR